jgi:hypothetical protein
LGERAAPFGLAVEHRFAVSGVRLGCGSTATAATGTPATSATAGEALCPIDRPDADHRLHEWMRGVQQPDEVSDERLRDPASTAPSQLPPEVAVAVQAYLASRQERTRARARRDDPACSATMASRSHRRRSITWHAGGSPAPAYPSLVGSQGHGTSCAAARPPRQWDIRFP